ncbi:MAG: SH3 domain-containing protein [Bdellovibrionota bacterium]
MKIERNYVLKQLCILGLLLHCNFSWATQKAKIVSPDVDIYAQSDFDSEIIATVNEGETYSISDKTFGPFYRIKLKNGKIGYVVDYELDIEGKGRFKEKDLDVLLYEDAMKVKPAGVSKQDKDEEEAVFGGTYAGPTLQLINFRENTLGSDQVDDLLAVGYKVVGDRAWSVLVTTKVPKYYAAKTGGTAKGAKFFADVGFSNNVVDLGRSAIRFSGTLFTQVSLLQLETTTRKYDLHDVTLGLALEVGWLVVIKSSAIDIAVKFYFDKTNYTGLGLSYLF